MKRWSLITALLIVMATAGVVYLYPRESEAAQNCQDWSNQTADRVETARLLLYPAERNGQSTGSTQGDAQALYDLANEQASSNPPDEAVNLNGDLVEAFSAGSSSLAGGQSADAQIALAKGIIYNADLRIAYLQDSC